MPKSQAAVQHRPARDEASWLLPTRGLQALCLLAGAWVRGPHLKAEAPLLPSTRLARARLDGGQPRVSPAEERHEPGQPLQILTLTVGVPGGLHI